MSLVDLTDDDVQNKIKQASQSSSLSNLNIRSAALPQLPTIAGNSKLFLLPSPPQIQSTSGSIPSHLQHLNVRTVQLPGSNIPTPQTTFHISGPNITNPRPFIPPQLQGTSSQIPSQPQLPPQISNPYLIHRGPTIHFSLINTCQFSLRAEFPLNEFYLQFHTNRYLRLLLPELSHPSKATPLSPSTSASTSPPSSYLISREDAIFLLSSDFLSLFGGLPGMGAVPELLLLRLLTKVPGVRFDWKGRRLCFPLEYHDPIHVALNSCQLFVEPLPPSTLSATQMQREKEKKRLEEIKLYQQQQQKQQQKIQDLDEEGSSTSTSSSSSSPLPSSSFSSSMSFLEADLSSRGLSPRFLSSLAPFQQEAVSFIVHTTDGRGMIADEMGLGKTRSALGSALAYRSDWPLLILCPSSAKHHWLTETRSLFVPEVLPDKRQVLLIESSSEKDHPILSPRYKPKHSSSSSSEPQIIILAYSLISSVLPKLMRNIPSPSSSPSSSPSPSTPSSPFPFNMIIADECHYLKNPSALRTKALLPVMKQTKRLVLLSGTPALSRPMELFTSLHALQPHLWKDPKTFARRYCTPLPSKPLSSSAKSAEPSSSSTSPSPSLSLTEKKKSSSFNRDQQGCSNSKELFVLLSSTVMIRRLKKDVLSTLPPKQRHVIPIKILDKDKRKQMREIFAELKASEEMLEKWKNELEVKKINKQDERRFRQQQLQFKRKEKQQAKALKQREREERREASERRRNQKEGRGMNQSGRGRGRGVGGGQEEVGEEIENSSEEEKEEENENVSWEEEDDDEEEKVMAEEEEEGEEEMKGGELEGLSDSEEEGEEDERMEILEYAQKHREKLQQVHERKEKKKAEEKTRKKTLMIQEKEKKKQEKVRKLNEEKRKKRRKNQGNESDIEEEEGNEQDEDEEDSDSESETESEADEEEGKDDGHQVEVEGEGEGDGDLEQELKKRRKALLFSLFSLSGEAKLPAILPHVESFIRDPLRGKLIVFAYHHNVLNGIEKLLKQLQKTQNSLFSPSSSTSSSSSSSSSSSALSFIRIDGSTSGENRHLSVNKFQTNPGCRVALLSLSAASVALTLTASSTVFFTELFWTPGTLLQAEDRAHRIGQLKAVHCYYFVSRLGQGSVDEVLWPMIKQKMKVLGEVVEGESGMDFKIHSTTKSSTSTSSSSSSSKASSLPSNSSSSKSTKTSSSFTSSSPTSSSSSSSSTSSSQEREVIEIELFDRDEEQEKEEEDEKEKEEQNIDTEGTGSPLPSSHGRSHPPSHLHFEASEFTELAVDSLTQNSGKKQLSLSPGVKRKKGSGGDEEEEEEEEDISRLMGDGADGSEPQFNEEKQEQNDGEGEGGGEGEVEGEEESFDLIGLMYIYLTARKRWGEARKRWVQHQESLRQKESSSPSDELYIPNPLPIENLFSNSCFIEPIQPHPPLTVSSQLSAAMNMIKTHQPPPSSPPQPSPPQPITSSSSSSISSSSMTSTSSNQAINPSQLPTTSISKSEPIKSKFFKPSPKKDPNSPPEIIEIDDD